MPNKLRVADLFCGAGGGSVGVEQSGVASVVYALDQWTDAIDTHKANFPDAKHRCAPIDRVDPREDVPPCDVILASPECTHHSSAAGGIPRDEKLRVTGWDVVQWTEAIRPKWLIVENVKEIQHWGPLGQDGRPLKSKRGETFRAWVDAIRSLNYHVEWRMLCAADYGAHTSRRRFFLVARRGPSTNPINWPEPTHTRKQWRPAREIIDWSIPCPSIFTRRRPLAENTINRIKVGLRKFCGSRLTIPVPFLVKTRGTGTVADCNDPVPTLTAGGNHIGIAQPFIVQNNKNAYVRDTERPFPTVTTKPTSGLTIPFIDKFYGTGVPSPTTDPLPTVTTKHRFALTLVHLMDDLGISDIGYRMFKPHELAAATGFPSDYQFAGGITSQTKQIGNAIPPAFTAAILKAIANH